jgi:GDP-4-dehydro-6-deoxy-D-mannose reductase
VIPTGAGEARALDLVDRAALSDLVREQRPEVVYHLAALSSVGRSWDDPAATLQRNVATDVNLLEALRRQAPHARIVWVSSCEVYGLPSQLPISEDAPVNPANPYGVSKAAGDLLAGVYGDAHGLEIVRARPFNHTGPGQLSMFLASSLARQGAAARAAGVASVRVVTGNPHTRRDFTDVRDVVRAYRLLASRAAQGIYNVSSADSISTAEQVQLLGDLIAPIRVEHVVDSARVRSHEVMELRGSNDRITRETGWRPEIPFRQTMSDALDWWTHELTRERSSDS